MSEHDPGPPREPVEPGPGEPRDAGDAANAPAGGDAPTATTTPVADDGDGTEAGRGPRTGVVIGATLLAAAVVAGLALGSLAWLRRGHDEAAPATSQAGTVPDSTLGEPTGALLVRREHDGLELRAAVQKWDDGGFVMVGGGAAVAVPAVDVIDVGAGVPVPADVVIRASEPGVVVAATEPATTTTTPTGDGTAPSPSTTAMAPDDALDGDGNGIPDVCEPRGDVSAWVIADDEIVQGSTPWTQGHIGGLYPSFMWGQPGSRILAIVVVVDDDVQLVTLDAGGRTDQMAPVEGIAVLAVRLDEAVTSDRGEPGPAVRTMSVIATRADGTTVRAGGTLDSGHPAWSMTGPCAMPGAPDGPIVVDIPVPTLPVAGEPPAEPAAARQAILDAYALVFDPEADPSARTAVVDDPAGLADLLAELDRNEIVGSGGRLTPTDLVFVSPTEAVFTVEVSDADGTMVWRRAGRARLLDGAWKITRGSVCGFDSPSPARRERH